MQKAGRPTVRALWIVALSVTLLTVFVFWLCVALSSKPLRLVRTWRAHRSLVTSLAFSPDSHHLLSASWDGTVRVWKVSDGKKVSELRLHRPIRFATLSPDGQLLATSTYDPTVQLWQLPDWTLVRTLKGHKDWVHEVAFSPDGKFLISGSRDGTVKIWRISDGQLVRTLSGHQRAIVTVDISPDGQLIASGSEDSMVKIWRIVDGKMVKVLHGRIAGRAVNVVRFSPNGKRLAFGDIAITIWHVQRWRKERELIGHRWGITEILFTPDSQCLLSASADGTVKVWRVADGAKVGEWKGEKAILRAWVEQADLTLFRLFGFDVHLRQFFLNIYPNSLALSPDGRLSAAGFAKGEIRLWRFEAR